jgi:hypothetical protein
MGLYYSMKYYCFTGKGQAIILFLEANGNIC